MSKIKILLVDDSSVVLHGLRCILKPYEEFEIVDEASDGCEAIVKAKVLLPDIVIMDAQMPIMNGIESTRYIKDCLPGVKVLVLTVHATHIDAAIDAAADGFLMKDSGRADLVQEIRRLAKLSPSLITN